MTTLEAINILVKKDGDVSLFPDFVGTEKVEKGIVVKMGMPAQAARLLYNDEYFPVFLIANKKEIERLKEENPNYSKLVEMAPALLEFVKFYAKLEKPYNVFVKKDLEGRANFLIQEIESINQSHGKK